MFFILYKNGTLINDSERFMINEFGDLNIVDLKVDDEAFYVCSIKNSNVIKYAQAYLTVNGINANNLS